MTLNRRSIVALLGLGLCITLWCIDRYLVPPPLASFAAQGAAVERAERNAVAGETGGKDEAAWLRGLIERLKGLSSGGDVREPTAMHRDPFDRSVLLPVQGAAETAANDSEAQRRAFLAAHRLTATILGPNPMAVVDRQSLRIGDVVDGFRLARIERGWVEFVSDTVRVRLDVPTPWRSRDR